MVVMITASTPSLNASRRPLLTRWLAQGLRNTDDGAGERREGDNPEAERPLHEVGVALGGGFLHAGELRIDRRESGAHLFPDHAELRVHLLPKLGKICPRFAAKLGQLRAELLVAGVGLTHPIDHRVRGLWAEGFLEPSRKPK